MEKTKLSIVFSCMIFMCHLFFAQETEVPSVFTPILKMGFTKGDIICSKKGLLVKEKKYNYLYKSNGYENELMVGVYTDTITKFSPCPIQQEGVAFVKCTDAKGQIKKGDCVTSFENGNAAKSDGQGWIVGVALEDAENGVVKIRILITYK